MGAQSLGTRNALFSPTAATGLVFQEYSRFRLFVRAVLVALQTMVWVVVLNQLAGLYSGPACELMFKPQGVQSCNSLPLRVWTPRLSSSLNNAPTSG